MSESGSAPGSDWFDQLPKVELHLHLEGAIPLPALFALVEKYGGHDEAPTPEALAARFVYSDFAHFIETWVWKNRFLRTVEDLRFIATAVAEDLRRQNILYAEAFYSPLDFERAGISADAMTRALREGLDAVAGVEVNLIADLVRDFGPARGAPVLEAVSALAESCGVVGIGIGGSEQSFPPEPYAELFEEARRRGLRTNAHAGEAAGAESVWGAVRSLKVDRIGHGTRAIEDDALMDHLAEARIPIEMCPQSNVCTGVVPDIDAHPLPRFLERGLLVTVNTDDPAMFNNDLAGEYRTLVERRGLSRETIKRLILNAADASWLDPDAKANLRARLLAHPTFA